VRARHWATRRRLTVTPTPRAYKSIFKRHSRSTVRGGGTRLPPCLAFHLLLDLKQREVGGESVSVYTCHSQWCALCARGDPCSHRRERPSRLVTSKRPHVSPAIDTPLPVLALFGRRASRASRCVPHVLLSFTSRILHRNASHHTTIHPGRRSVVVPACLDMPPARLACALPRVALGGARAKGAGESR